ncbi:NAD(P)-binding domain-containing protein [Micrococcus porci]|uniref:NAD(P)-binding domain-containing protein n=1 Tax=Micrococcus porci TaxID=2856555 RepID=UPI003CF8A592
MEPDVSSAARPAHASVLVIGAGQAGLSAAYHLGRRGFAPFAPGDDGASPVPEGAPGTFVVLDAEDGPGGAWRHRWDTLLMGTVNGIHELPGHPVPPADPHARATTLLPEYFAEYEEMFDLPILRPVRVERVERIGVPGAATGFTVTTDGGGGTPSSWTADFVVNATGTWTSPHWPYVPGAGTFAGRQLHTHDYTRKEDFTGQRVAIVGMGVSATQLLDEISQVAETVWFTRREPQWIEDPSPGRLAEAVDGVDERTRAGLPPASVVSATGMFKSPWVRDAEARGALVRHPMFTRIEPEGVVTPDGRIEEVDVILWATGFRPAIRHLAPLGLRTPAGGIRAERGRATDEPHLFLIGYGPSQSTVGANRAGRDAAIAILRDLRERDGAD